MVVMMVMIVIKETCRTCKAVSVVTMEQSHHALSLNETALFRWKLVSWCFEPSQPQRITSGLKTNFSLYPSNS